MSGTASTRWFWSDWISDPGLRLCSHAAKGLWIDMLCLMSETGGYLTAPGISKRNGRPTGRPLNVEDLARATNSKPDEVERLLFELENNGVFSRTKSGLIYSRRQVRASKNRKNGTLGGSPKLLNHKDEQKSVKAHIPEPEPEPKIPKRESYIGWPADAFEQFWEKYPEKVGKKAAHKSFVVASKSGVQWDIILPALERYIASKPPDRAWCHPTTWLNQGRWDDQPTQNGGGTINGHGGSRSLQDDSKSVSKAADKLLDATRRGEFTIGPRPSLMPNQGQGHLRLLPKG